MLRTVVKIQYELCTSPYRIFNEYKVIESAETSVRDGDAITGVTGVMSSHLSSVRDRGRRIVACLSVRGVRIRVCGGMLKI